MLEALLSSQKSVGGVYPKGWLRLADSPVVANAHTMVSINDELFVFGGSNPVNNTLFKYSTIQDTWTEVTSPATRPSSRFYHSAVTINGKMYVYGGMASSALSDIWEYTPLSNDWIKKTNGDARYGHSSVNLNDKIVVMGGYNSSYNVTRSVRQFDPLANTWSSFTLIPSINVYFKAVAAQNSIYIYGGTTGAGRVASLLEYNQIRDTWVEKSPLTPGRQLHSLNTIDDFIYVFGGSGEFTLTEADAFARYKISTDTWELVPLTGIYPSLRSGHASCNHGNSFFILGGGNLNDLWVYTP